MTTPTPTPMLKEFELSREQVQRWEMAATLALNGMMRSKAKPKMADVDKHRTIEALCKHILANPTRPQSQGSDEAVRLALKKDNEIAWDLYHAIEKFLGEWASVQNVHVPENLADLHLSFCEVELPTNKHEVEAQLKGLNHV
jgi:hypothetical protein